MTVDVGPWDAALRKVREEYRKRFGVDVPSDWLNSNAESVFDVLCYTAPFEERETLAVMAECAARGISLSRVELDAVMRAVVGDSRFGPLGAEKAGKAVEIVAAALAIPKHERRTDVVYGVNALYWCPAVWRLDMDITDHRDVLRRLVLMPYDVPWSVTTGDVLGNHLLFGVTDTETLFRLVEDLERDGVPATAFRSLAPEDVDADAFVQSMTALTMIGVSYLTAEEIAAAEARDGETWDLSDADYALLDSDMPDELIFALLFGRYSGLFDDEESAEIMYRIRERAS